MSEIKRFAKEYAFLSNYYEAPVNYHGFTYGSSEAAYQAQKSGECELFATLRPHQSKVKARELPVREDWDDVKVNLMEEIVRAKFTQNSELAEKLISTGHALLLEGNGWHDTFWGIDDKTGEGENNLGKILMKIRDELRPETSKTFCALFDISNEHIIKDHGLLSWGMHEYHNYNSFMATYENGDYPNLKYLPGLRLEFIPRISGDWLKDSCAWLRENAKRIDVLFIYHLYKRSLKHALVYKLHNPRGKIYLKMDGWSSTNGRHPLNYPKTFLLTKLCKCISTELEENVAMLSRDWRKEIISVANPINPDEIQKPRKFSQRSNTILNVGRPGSEQKAVEILLEAFAKIGREIPDWKLKLAGRIEENETLAEDFYAKYPDLRERIIFTGEIRDRQELIEMYRDAKIFAFPSRWESFGIALTEAMAQGCFAVVSKIFTSEKLTGGLKFGLGSEVNDVDGLAKNLLYACNHETHIEQLALNGREEILRRCDLKQVCKLIADKLK